MKCAADKRVVQIVRKDMMNQTIRYMFVAMASILTDKYGFDNEQIYQCVKQFQERFEAIRDDYISFSDLERTLKEEYGISIKQHKKRKDSKTKEKKEKKNAVRRSNKDV